MTSPIPQAQPLGPGSLLIGSAGSELDLTAQATNMRVVPAKDVGDPTPTLGGIDLPGDRTYNWTLSGTLLQDFTPDGMFDYSWSHAGAEVPFVFTPITALGRIVEGVCIVDPLEMGGDVKKKNTTNFEWQIVGTPVLGDDVG